MRLAGARWTEHDHAVVGAQSIDDLALLGVGGQREQRIATQPPAVGGALALEPRQPVPGLEGLQELGEPERRHGGGARQGLEHPVEVVDQAGAIALAQDDRRGEPQVGSPLSRLGRLPRMLVGQCPPQGERLPPGEELLVVVAQRHGRARADLVADQLWPVGVEVVLSVEQRPVTDAGGPLVGDDDVHATGGQVGADVDPGSEQRMADLACRRRPRQQPGADHQLVDVVLLLELATRTGELLVPRATGCEQAIGLGPRLPAMQPGPVVPVGLVADIVRDGVGDLGCIER